ncbi:MAG: GNAT family N-acetyltransferase [Porphyromonas sp.]|nr:GNAT family N-acetyltransferase [Porphyromonas sp.]
MTTIDTISVRKATPADAELISKAVAGAIGDESSAYYCGKDFLGVFREIARTPHTQYSYENAIIAETDSVPVGVAVSYDGEKLKELRTSTLSIISEMTGKMHEIADETEAGELYLDSFYVLPEYRGKGIGKKLLEALAGKARVMGLPAVGLLVDFDNPKAEKLYLSQGFSPRGEKDFLGHAMHHLQLFVHNRDMPTEPVFNAHNKEEYPPMHTVEHVLNGAMVRLFGTGRSVSAHIEQKKSRMDFVVDFIPSDEDLRKLESEINRVLDEDLQVSYSVVTQEEARRIGVDLSRIPDDASEMVRIVRVGDYDACLCIGRHVEHTGQCGHIDLYAHTYDPETGRWRVRFRLRDTDFG